MSHGSDTPLFLVASPWIRCAKLWARLQRVRIQSCGRREFSVKTHLSANVPVLLYQLDGSLADAFRFIEAASKAQSDLCIIVFGRNIGADNVARLLRHGAFDYLVWPCTAARLSESIASGLANRRTFLEVRDLSDALARTNQALAQDRRILTQCNRNLSVLTQLTQALAAPLETEAIVKALFTGLPQLIEVELIGLVCTNPERVWTWSPPGERRREEEARSLLMHRLRSPKSRRTGPHTALHLVRPSHLTLVPPSAAPVHAADAVSAHEVPLPLDPYAGGALRIERARPFTEQEQHLLATVAASLTLALRNAEAYQQIQDAALRDPLTGALNRRALDGPLMRELRAGLRYGMPACLLLLDLDYFKAVNDLLGHVAGDDVLKRVAALIQETVREVDSVGRYGGEEFAVVLPHTDLNQAQALAERLRSIIERHAFELEDGQVRTTASIGLASLDDPAIATASDWIEAADSALYEAKSRGRNRVVTHAPRNSAPACAAAMCAA